MSTTSHLATAPARPNEDPGPEMPPPPHPDPGTPMPGDPPGVPSRPADPPPTELAPDGPRPIRPSQVSTAKFALSPFIDRRQHVRGCIELCSHTWNSG